MSKMIQAKWWAVALAVSMMVLAGCSSATQYTMQAGDRSAGAEGTITLEEDDNENYQVTLEMAHAPRPDQLDESKSVYTVWLMPHDTNEVYNMGRIRLDDDRAGTLKFTSPFPGFDLKVSAEEDGLQVAPSDQVVLRYTL